MEKEVWRPIFGYEGLYSASNLGRIKSVERVIYKGFIPKRVSERILKSCLDRRGCPELHN